MTSSILKTSISYIAVAVLSGIFTTLFMNFDYAPQSNHCKLCEHRLRRDVKKLPLCKEEKKNRTSQPKDNIEKVFLKKAVKIGAVCLDGSPPGYHFRNGFGNGTRKWILFFNGGAWCNDEQACYQRSHMLYGSTRFKTTFWESGLYSRDSRTNPVFHNWNKVFIIYCDGSSFTGMREKPVYFKDKPVYFRGKAVLDAIIEDLLDRGVGTASDVLLTGSSAGSLAVLIHADYIKDKLNPRTKVRVVSDSGYFIDMKTHYGARKARNGFRRMLFTHNATAGLHQGCRRRIPVAQQWKCFFPQYFFQFIETPVFVLQSAYDVWQIANSLDVVCTVPSYKDMLVFRSLNVLRTSRKTRRGPAHVITSSRNALPRVISYAQKLNSNVRTYSTFLPQYIPRGFPRAPRVDNPSNVESLVSDINYPSSTLRNTFENAHVFASPSTPVRRGSRGRNVLRTQSSWNNPLIAPQTRTNTLLYARTFNAPATSEDQRDLGNAQAFLHYNSRPVATSSLGVPAAHPSYNAIPGLPSTDLAQSYSAIPANAHYMQKRELRNAQPRDTIKMPQNSNGWHWQSLYQSPPPCTRDETEKILVMRSLTLDALKPVLAKPGSGLFLSPCFEHTQANRYNIWKNGKIKGKSPRDAIAEWYFGRSGNHIHIGQEFSFGSCVP